MNDSNEDKVVAFLGELDRRLSETAPGKTVDLYVFGGAATVVHYGARRATVDVDLLAGDDQVGRRLQEWGHKNSELHRKFDLYVDPANISLIMIEDPDWKDRVVEMLPGRFEVIRLWALGKEDLILSKLARYEERDRADIEHLAKEGVDPEKLLRLYKSARSYFIGDVAKVDLTFKIVMSNCFGRDDIRLHNKDQTLDELNRTAKKERANKRGRGLDLSP